MKASRLVALAAIIVALFALLLVLPSATRSDPEESDAGASVNWVTCGENPNRFCPELGWRCGNSAVVKEMPDGSLVGHASFTPTGPGPPFALCCATLLNYDPYTGEPLDVFREERQFRVAEFVMDLGSGAFPFRYLKVKLCDGCWPETADKWEDRVCVGGVWVPFGGGPAVPSSDIQVRLGNQRSDNTIATN